MPRKPKTAAPKFTPEELAEYKELLLHERQEIMQRLHRSSSTFHSNRQAGEEAADIGSDDFQREVSITMMSGDTTKLGMIEAALKNITKGEYGICQDCHEKIASGRLHAKPYARYCITCKEKREKSEGNNRNQQ